MYKRHGDTAIAEMLNERFPKAYPWTKKHVEKRRNYFGLKRTKQEEHRLRVLNNKDGRQYRMWEKRGRAREGEIRSWNNRLYIKVGGGWRLYYRHLLRARKGQIARSFEGVPVIITRKENQLLNAKMRASMPEDLRQAVKVLNELKRVVNEKRH